MSTSHIKRESELADVPENELEGLTDRQLAEIKRQFDEAKNQNLNIWQSNNNQTNKENEQESF